MPQHEMANMLREKQNEREGESNLECVSQNGVKKVFVDVSHYRCKMATVTMKVSVDQKARLSDDKKRGEEKNEMKGKNGQRTQMGQGTNTTSQICLLAVILIAFHSGWARCPAPSLTRRRGTA